jgi:hypothetical protein
MKHITTLLLSFTLLVCLNCDSRGRMSQQECATQVRGSTYCGWETDDNQWVEVCCPPSHPYCGHRGSTCAIGQCCAAPPLSLGLRPLDK